MTPVEHVVPARAMPRLPEFIAIMAAMMALNALAIDMMLPALEQIRDDLRVVGANRQQLVVTSYFVGFALGQLFMGPLSDRFGRRPVLFAGLAAYIVTAFAAMAAGSLDALLAARLLQGIGSAAPRVVAVAVIRDIYGGRRMSEVMSFVMMVFIIVPVLAPSVGAAVLAFGDWRLIFGFLGVAAVAILTWTALRLPETRAAERREPLTAAWLVAALRETLTTRQTLGYTLATGFLFGALLSYISSAQQIFTEVYPIGDWFPAVFGSVAIGMAGASLINSQLVERVGMRRLSHAALLGFLVSGLAMAGAALTMDPPPLLLLLALLALALFCFGLIMPNFNALAMEPMGRIAGTASSMIGALTTAMAAVMGAYVGQSFNGSVTPLALGFAVFAAASLVVVFVTERGRLFRVGAASARRTPD